MINQMRYVSLYSLHLFTQSMRFGYQVRYVF